MRTSTGQCDSCQLLRINGVICHETGCPEAWRDSVRECRECGCEFKPKDRDQVCCSSDCQAMRYGIFTGPKDNENG